MNTVGFGLLLPWKIDATGWAFCLPKEALFQSIQISIGASEVDDAVCHKRRREDCSDIELSLSRDNRCFAPVRIVKHRRIKFPISGQDPTLILLGDLGLKFPKQLSGLDIACGETAVEDAVKNDVAHHCRRREDISLVLFSHHRLSSNGIEHVKQTRIGSSEENLAFNHSR